METLQEKSDNKYIFLPEEKQAFILSIQEVNATKAAYADLLNEREAWEKRLKDAEMAVAMAQAAVQGGLRFTVRRLGLEGNWQPEPDGSGLVKR